MKLVVVLAIHLLFGKAESMHIKHNTVDKKLIEAIIKESRRIHTEKAKEKENTHVIGCPFDDYTYYNLRCT
jgi:hypothetical protein